MRRILRKDREQGLFLLLFLYAINRFLSGFKIEPDFVQLRMYHVVMLILTFGAIGLFLTYFIAAPVFALAGRALGGDGDTEDVRVAFAWSSVPSIIVLVFQVGAMFVLGRDMFIPGQGSDTALPMSREIALAATPLHIWSQVLFVGCLAEVHRFSIVKALATVALVFVGIVALAVGIGIALAAAGVMPS